MESSKERLQKNSWKTPKEVLYEIVRKELLIYRAKDKNNIRLDRRMMVRFYGFLDDLELQELFLHGRLFTWSNVRDHLTLECIDRDFIFRPLVGRLRGQPLESFALLE